MVESAVFPQPNTTLTTYSRYNGLLQGLLKEYILYLLGPIKARAGNRWQRAKRENGTQPTNLTKFTSTLTRLTAYVHFYPYFKEQMHEYFIHSQGYFNEPELWTTEQVKPAQVSQHNGIKSTATQQVA